MWRLARAAWSPATPLAGTATVLAFLLAGVALADPVSFRPVARPLPLAGPDVGDETSVDPPEIQGHEPALIPWSRPRFAPTGLAADALKPTTTLIVTTCANTGSGGTLSLREAIDQANAAGGNTLITFDPSLTACVINPTSLTRLSALTANNITVDGDLNNDGVPDIRIGGGSAGSGAVGVTVSGNNCTIDGLSICCFSSHGILIYGSNNIVQHCTVGASNLVGIEIIGGSNNLVGPGNISNQNTWFGFVIRGGLATGNQVFNSQMAFNGQGGVGLDDAAHGNQIGPSNILSKNGWEGVHIEDGCYSNEIYSNSIGTNAAGTTDFGNSMDGVAIANGSYLNQVHDNLISGNAWAGVHLVSPSTTGNVVASNRIGVNGTSTAAMPNDIHGIAITDGASANTIGPANLVSGNLSSGIVIYSNAAPTSGNIVRENIVGLNGAQSGAIPNGQHGIRISIATTDNDVGPDNVVSGNARSGVFVSDAGTTGTIIHGNRIGTNDSLSARIPNSEGGVLIRNAASSNTVGPDNVVVGNFGDGVQITDVGSTGNIVRDNFIGLKPSMQAAGNSGAGIAIRSGATMNTIGPANVVGSNTSAGIRVTDAGTSSNEIVGNLIGVGADKVTARGNGTWGVIIDGGAASNRVMGANWIGANALGGIQIGGSGTVSNSAYGNTIGMDPHSNLGVGNVGNGVHITDNAASTFIGLVGTSPTGGLDGNVIAENDGHGVRVDGGATQAYVRGNAIWSNRDLAISVDTPSAAALLPWVTAFTPTSVDGRCLGPDGGIIDIYHSLDFETEVYVGSASLLHNRFSYSGPTITGADLRATITTVSGGTSEVGLMPPQVWFYYRNSNTAPDLIADYWDHAGMEFDFYPHRGSAGDKAAGNLFVESVPGQNIPCGVGGGPSISTLAGFISHAELIGSRPDVVGYLTPDQYATGMFDFIWSNSSYTGWTVIGNASYSYASGSDKGPTSFSCVGLTEVAAEAAGYDITPAAREHDPSSIDFVSCGHIFYPGAQRDQLSSGVAATPGPSPPKAAAAADVRGFHFARTSGDSLPYSDEPTVPFPLAMTRVSVFGTAPAGGGVDGISVSNTLAGILGCSASAPGQYHVAGSFDGPSNSWKFLLGPLTGANRVRVDLFLSGPLADNPTPFTIRFLSSGVPVPAEDVNAIVAYAPIGAPIRMGDVDYDGDVDSVDFGAFQAAYSGSQQAPGYVAPSQDERYFFDFDGDTDVDCLDWLDFSANWTGPPATPPALAICAGVDVGDDVVAARPWTDPPFPNPFRRSTTLRFDMKRPGRARVAVLDVAGRIVAIPLDGMLNAGWHAVAWNGQAPDGSDVSPGVYFMRLTTPGTTRTFSVARVR